MERLRAVTFKYDEFKNPNYELDKRTQPFTVEHIAYAGFLWCAGVLCGLVAFAVELYRGEKHAKERGPSWMV